MADANKFTLKQIGNYKFAGRTLGKGNFARVELAEHRLTGDKVAIKVIDMKTIKEEYVRRNILREALIMKKVQHTNIVKLYETLKHDYLYCLVTELVRGGDLRNYVQLQKSKKISEGKARMFFRQLLSAVKHLHDKNIVHRDLKMDNILLNETKNSIKIVDFGLSNSFNKGELLKTHCGSPEYAAPELFEKGCLYGPSVDIWSMGVILYAMVIGHLPFSTLHRGAIGRDDLYQNAKKGLTLLHEKYLSRISTGCRSLLSKLLQPDPTNRASLEEISHHVWVTENGRYPLVSQPSFLLPKNIRDKVIDRVASLYSCTTADMELRVESSKHDAVCAVYNLLLDAAVRDCRHKSRARHCEPSGDLSKSMQASKANEREMNQNEKEDTALQKDGVKIRSGSARTARTNSAKIKADASSGRSHVNPSSSVKIIEFTDAIKMEGRAKSPIIRKPSSAKRYQKSPQFRKKDTALPSDNSNKSEAQSTSITDHSGKERQSPQLKKHLYCSDAASGLAACCRISRFPEEDKSARRPKVELKPSLVVHNSKQLTFAAGFKAPLSVQKLKANACTCVSSNSSLRRKDKKCSDTKKQSVSGDDNKPRGSQQAHGCRRGSLQCESNQSMKSDKGYRLCSYKQSVESTHSEPSKSSYAAMQSKTRRKSVQASTRKKDGMILLTSLSNRDESRLRGQQRFGSAFSELRRRSGFSLRESVKREVKRSASIANAASSGPAKENDTNDTTTESSGIVSKKSSDCSKKDGKLKESLKKLESYQMQNEKTVKATEYEHGSKTDGSSKSSNPDTSNSHDTRYSKTTDETVYRGSSPQFQRYLNFIETQRKVSLGILKTPSKTSNAELTRVSSVSEKKNLKVTFQDEVCDQQILKKFQGKKFNPQVNQVRIETQKSNGTKEF